MMLPIVRATGVWVLVIVAEVIHGVARTLWPAGRTAENEANGTR